MKYPLTILETLPLFDCLFFNLFQNLEAKNARYPHYFLDFSAGNWNYFHFLEVKPLYIFSKGV